jgi:hypothetical protein
MANIDVYEESNLLKFKVSLFCPSPEGIQASREGRYSSYFPATRKSCVVLRDVATRALHWCFVGDDALLRLKQS